MREFIPSLAVTTKASSPIEEGVFFPKKDKDAETHYFEHATVSFDDDMAVVKICTEDDGWWWGGKHLENGSVQIYENGTMFLEGDMVVIDSVDWREVTSEDIETYEPRHIRKRKKWFFFGRDVFYVDGRCMRKKRGRYELETKHWRVVWERGS